MFAGAKDVLGADTLSFHEPDLSSGAGDPLGLRPDVPDNWLEELALPDLQTLPPSDLQLLIRGSGTRVLRFSNSVWNRGHGALEVRGSFDRKNNRVQVSQFLYGTGEKPRLQPIGDFDYHPVHAHWHWEGFSVYEIWSVRADGKLGEMLVTSGKVGYCMVDNTPAGAELTTGLELDTPSRQQYALCHWRKQGLSVGWVDTYRRHLDGQSLDVTGVPDGQYALRSTVNPAGILLESDTTNNAAVVYFRLNGNEVTVIGNALGASFINNRNR